MLPFNTPVTEIICQFLRNEAAEYATVLETVRLGPLAFNKQPWRILNYNNY